MLYEGNGVNLKAYVLSIVIAAVICAIINGFLGNKTTVGRIAGLLGGILMVTTVITPLKDISFSNITDYWDGVTADAASIAAEGTAMAQNSTAEIIKSQTEAYIMDKATEMGLEITVEVGLNGSNGNIPCHVTVTGAVSPYAKTILCTFIEDNLGISKENQQWS